MIRTILTPTNNQILLPIPQEMVGKKIEVLLYGVEEITEQRASPKSVSSLRGQLNLTEEEYVSFDQYLTNSRNEWNNNI